MTQEELNADREERLLQFRLAADLAEQNGLALAAESLRNLGQGKVWYVEMGSHDDTRVAGVFTTKSMADRCSDALEGTDDGAMSPAEIEIDGEAVVMALVAEEARWREERTAQIAAQRAAEQERIVAAAMEPGSTRLREALAMMEINPYMACRILAELGFAQPMFDTVTTIATSKGSLRAHWAEANDQVVTRLSPALADPVDLSGNLEPPT